MVAVAEKPVTVTVPRELLVASGGLSPNLLLLLAGMAIATLSVTGYWCWGLPGWACFSLNTLALHIAGTVIHDACHHSAHSNRIVNAILGHISAQMLCFSYPVFTRVHMQHHANVNDPDNDPDHFVSTGGPLWLIAPRFFYHEVFFFKRRLWRKNELLEWFLARGFLVLIIYFGTQYGFYQFIANYWFLPSAVVGLALGLFFDYLPHRPFQERDRWKNARIYPSAILNLLIMGQNYHLIHHLWPSIPWYRYQAAYRATKLLLDEKGSPQTLGILQDGKNFWSFVYDVFIGIRSHH
jgi:beta-carotene hydroxylase